ncbi:bifunctional 3-(3-hydroxy-phenyl)propionate/3-hydroxycinnamic acid hydroxylase [Rhodococcus ruber]|uniref:Bifunctional 3-(3-hydroxy-phenyl)propionate/3-hydroxycinnamic acid hydroxylase n=1 Tax=Rhodococcus ruber TaxID=1830 RepID=A0ABT4ML99_9NOCA|nr:bifunctional 3-(3-hydroxy-phenyl)propionate/3-hydroxycinnamic acid hydroxylase [Rhodococcus ruber]MCZ4521762.1 bifunctional 3-(3-hydroxy-phenyl)propionate/3-hydroxycinnamic acid hydroxylase [Rhodococcus ruber]
METKQQCTVAIVGYGPVGGTLANLLARQGIDVVVIESHANVYPTPRAGGLVPESMRLLQMLDLADELVQGMNDWTFWYDVVDKDWNKILERTPEMGPPTQQWAHTYTFLQPELETAVRAMNSKFGVREYLGYKVVSTERTPGTGVDLLLDSIDSDEQIALHAEWVIGCDGSNSTIRNSVGTGEQEDLGGDQSWLLVHLRVLDDKAVLPERIFKWANPERPAAFIPGLPRNICLFEFRVLPGETHEELTNLDKVYELLSPWLTPEQVELLRVTVYTFRTRVAHQWRDGRILIAGDSAHVMPPELGEGLNSGLRDVMNLAWKLAGVVNGRFDESILDTYTVERRPHVREFTVLSHAIAQAIDAIANDPDTYRANLALDSAFSHPWPRLGPGLQQEPFPAGMVSEQPLLASGVRYDDHVGYRFSVLADAEWLAEADLASDPVLGALDVVGVAADSDSARDWLARLGHRAVVVRPDRYILGVADSADELRELFAPLAGYLQATDRAAVPTA